VDELIKAFHKILQPKTPRSPTSTAHDQCLVAERCKSLAKTFQQNTPRTRPSAFEQEKKMKMDELDKAFRTIYDCMAPEEREQSSQCSVPSTGTKGTWKRLHTACGKTKSHSEYMKKPPVSYFLPLTGPLESIWIRPPPPMTTNDDELSSSHKENEQQCDRVEKELNDRLEKLSLNVIL